MSYTEVLILGAPLQDAAITSLSSKDLPVAAGFPCLFAPTDLLPRVPLLSRDNLFGTCKVSFDLSDRAGEKYNERGKSFADGKGLGQLERERVLSRSRAQMKSEIVADDRRKAISHLKNPIFWNKDPFINASENVTSV